MSTVSSRHPLLVLFYLLSVLVLMGGSLAGCGSSSTSTSAGGTIDQGPDDPIGPDVYARGKVIYPDTTAVSEAFVYTDPNVGQSVQTDSSGQFRFTESFSGREYTFTAVDRREGMEGKTVVRPGSNDRIRETIWIMIGVGEKSLNALSIDSVRATPGGPGMKRTGN